jgi:hypothetical protein
VLLPHPGLKVAKGASRGAKKDLEIDFIEELNVRIYSIYIAKHSNQIIALQSRTLSIV